MGAVTGWLVVPDCLELDSVVPDWLVLWVIGVPFTGLAGRGGAGVSGVLVCGLNLRLSLRVEAAVPRAYETLLTGNRRWTEKP